MEPQKGKCKQDPRPMCKAPPYCYLQITIQLNSLLITLEEKIHSNSRCLLAEKSKKKKYKTVDGVGTVTSTCDRDRSLLMSMCKIFPPQRYYCFINKLLKRSWTRETTWWFTLYCETHKTMNTRNIYGMILCCEKLANKAHHQQ